jgi:hypothetical protein
MFQQLIIENPSITDDAVALGGQIELSRRFLGNDNPIVSEAESSLSEYGKPDRRLCKTGLLKIWESDRMSFAAKCLVTIMWGHPDHRSAAKVYSEHNLVILNSGDIERQFYSLFQENDFEAFKTGLDSLYREFNRGGAFHLNGIGVSFFTKLFHFFFASHPPKSNPGYLPVIADEIIRSAVFAEMMDRGENVNDVFYTKDATLRTYTGYTDRFNSYALDYPDINPFALEDILFNKSKGLGEIYVAGYNRRLSLPHWTAGRYNDEEQLAIVFNNLKGETYLFEGLTAQLVNELLNYEYMEGFRLDELCSHFNCGYFDLLSFFQELLDKKIIIDHNPGKEELDRIKRTVNKEKSAFLKSSKGIGNFQASYESVDNDYRSKVAARGIPFAASIELTYACNEACIHCYNPNSPREGGIGTQKVKPKAK